MTKWENLSRIKMFDSGVIFMEVYMEVYYSIHKVKHTSNFQLVVWYQELRSFNSSQGSSDGLTFIVGQQLGLCDRMVVPSPQVLNVPSTTIHWIEWLVGTGRQRTAWRKTPAWNSRIFQGVVDPSGCCPGKQPALHFAAHVEAPSLKRCHLVRALIYSSHRISAFYCSMATEEMVGPNAGNTPSRVSWSAHSM